MAFFTSLKDSVSKAETHPENKFITGMPLLVVQYLNQFLEICFFLQVSLPPYGVLEGITKMPKLQRCLGEAFSDLAFILIFAITAVNCFLEISFRPILLC